MLTLQGFEVLNIDRYLSSLRCINFRPSLNDTGYVVDVYRRQVLVLTTNYASFRKEMVVGLRNGPVPPSPHVTLPWVQSESRKSIATQWVTGVDVLPPSCRRERPSTFCPLFRPCLRSSIIPLLSTLVVVRGPPTDGRVT